VGLIGGSIGLALRSQGRYVCGYDTSAANGAVALRLGCVSEMARTLEQAVSGSEIVVMSLPVRAIVELLPAVDIAASPSATIIDTGSVKRPVMDAAARLTGSTRVIGGHPIAGKEESGPAAADAGLFRRRPFLLTSVPGTRSESIEMALSLVHTLGAYPVRMTATEHDRVLARTSHLPQILSTALATTVGPERAGLSGPGLQDMTRLAMSDSVLWRDILLSNSDNVLDAARELAQELNRITSAIGSGDGDAVLDYMIGGRTAALTLRDASV
jgi:prephenate dehydrogenase